jgi:hypothetical protein
MRDRESLFSTRPGIALKERADKENPGNPGVTRGSGGMAINLDCFPGWLYFSPC